MTIFVIFLMLLIPSLTEAITRTATTRAAFDAAVNASARNDIVLIPAGTYTNWGSTIIPATKDTDAAGRIFIEGQQDTSGNNLTIFQGQDAFEIEIRANNWTIQKLLWRSQTTCATYMGVSAENAMITLNGSQGSGINNVLIENFGGSATTGGAGDCIRIVKTSAVNRNTTDYFIRGSIFRNIWQRPNGSFIQIGGNSDMGFPVRGTIDENFLDSRTCVAGDRYCYWVKAGDNATAGAMNAAVTFSYNYIRNTTKGANGHDDMHIKYSGWNLIGNTFEGASRVVARQAGGWFVARNRWINPNANLGSEALVVYGENHTIVNNLAYSTGGGRNWLAMGMGNPVPTSGPRIGQPDHQVFANSVVAHNTCDGFSESCFLANRTSNGNNQGLTTINPSNIRFHNNAVRQTGGTMFAHNNCAAAFSAVSHNARNGAGTAGCMTTGTNNIAPTNMQFVAIGSDYDLQASSLLKNAGVNVSGVVETDFDINGHLRDTPDIGAYEQGASDPGDPDTGGECTTIFGTAPEYQYCSQTTSACKFNTNTTVAGGTCAALCASFGSRACLSAENNTTQACTSTGTSTCTAIDSTKICECEKNLPPPPPTIVTRYVDASCPTSGTGETTTCGANGPWRSLTHGVVTLDCTGMGPGSIIEIKGNAADNTNGNWYGGIFYPDFNVSPDSACSGVTVRNQEDTYVNLDGSLDIKGSGWVLVGSNVYECRTGTCGPIANYPYAAWAKVGATEYKLDLIQSVRTCTTSLAAGKMTYNDSTRRVCVHMPDNSNPASATYFRIPYQESAFKLQNENVDGLIFQSHPDGGRLIVQRYRDNLFELAASVNQHITIRDVEMAWAGARAISAPPPNADGHFKFINNHIHHIGMFAIRVFDRSTGLLIEGNNIHDLGKSPDWERCQGVGAGCFATFSDNPNGVYVDGGDLVGVLTDTGTHGIIRGNEIYNVGEGRQGRSYGIQIASGSYRSLVENNKIYDSTSTNLGFQAILVDGIAAGSAHDETMIRNNRMENVDWCIAVDFSVSSDQTGKRFYGYGNTCHNPIRNCWIHQQNPNTGNRFRFRNNLCSKTNGYVKLMDVPASNTWSEFFWNNGFECSHSACAGQDIVTMQGVNYRRDGECTEGTNCIADMVPGGNNIYGSFLVQTGTLEIIVGSDAIDTGGLGLDLPTDYLGNDRLAPVSGVRTDIGAHELQATAIPLALVQDGYRYYGRLRQDKEGPIDAQNVNPPLYKNSNWNMRLGVYGSADSGTGNADIVLYYQHCSPSCGSYAPITPNCDDNPLCLVNNPAVPSGTPVESDLIMAGVPLVVGSQYIEAEEEGEGFVSIHLGRNERVELVYNLGAGFGVDQGDFFNLQLRYGDGTVLSYGSIPVVTMAQARSRYEFNR